jgi:hypothetical protein
VEVQKTKITRNLQSDERKEVDERGMEWSVFTGERTRNICE